MPKLLVLILLKCLNCYSCLFHERASMKSQNKESGSIVHIVVIVILIIAVLGLLGFVFWQNFVNKPVASSTETTTTSTTTQTTPSIAISEWNLKGTYNQDKLGTLSYEISGNKLTFSSSVVEGDILPCAGLSASSWGIARAQAGDKDQFGADVANSWTKIGDAYYNRLYPQSGCEDKTSQASSVDEAYRSLFGSLVQAQ